MYKIYALNSFKVNELYIYDKSNIKRKKKEKEINVKFNFF